MGPAAPIGLSSRLRHLENLGGDGASTLREAADEIDRLRERDTALCKEIAGLVSFKHECQAENAKLREALEQTQHHLAKLVNETGLLEFGASAGNPDGWLAAQQQVLANRELLAALAERDKE